MPGAVADLEQPLARGASAAGEPVATVLARELDAVLLQPVNRARRLARQHLDEPAVGRLVRALPDVLGVLLGESSSPKAAWMPPWAFAELHD